MPRLSVSVEDDLYDWLEAEAEKRDRSLAWMVRRCCEIAHEGKMPDGSISTMDADNQTFMSLVRRVDGLESRLDELEAKTEAAPDSKHPSSASEPRGKRETQADQSGRNRRSRGSPEYESYGDPRVVKWLAENQPASKSEILSEFSARDIGGVQPRSWWERHGRQAIKHFGGEYERGVGWTFPDGVDMSDLPDGTGRYTDSTEDDGQEDR